MKDGKYVIIIGTQWQWGHDYGCIVDKVTALKEIVDSDNLDLLEAPRFKELKKTIPRKIRKL